MSEDTSLTPEQEEEEQVERIIPEEEDNSPAPDRFDRVQPFFDLLKVDGVKPDDAALRDHFNRLWQYEKADALPEDEQFLTTIGLFIYTAHLLLDDNNINTLRAREHINKALTEWKRPETEKQVAREKASDNPFKTFVDQEAPRVDEYFSWRNFLLEHKKADANGWNFKMRQCWFHRFFIRYGRVDFIETACEFDRIPWRAREDYVDLKLNNTFAKLGSFCQFKYSPKK
ncbi:MAG: L-2-amino-thiazoline-4-carboxylic acid hydrolase [Nitrospinaceae bacterium]